MTTEPFIVLCPGQGAQAVGMAKAWGEASPEAAAVIARADAALAEVWARPETSPGADLAGTKLSTLMFEGPIESLNRTDISQPAIYTASVASYHGWCATSGTDPDEAPMVAAAGLSLGEYSALHLAGAFTFEDGLKLVALRGRAMQDAAQAVDSSMVALIGADEDSANQVCAAAKQGDVLVCANFNAPGQVVISGSAGACDRAEEAAVGLGLRATRLRVAGAFHSPLMQPAAERLQHALGQAEIRAPRCPVMSNVTGEGHRGPDEIRRGLFDQLTSPVRWATCCERLIEDHGGGAAAVLHEMAPGKTLSGMMRRIDRGTKVVGHDGPE
ncbi:MAG: [acyl-carrier-protein] S-malonyltransferase [Phycisphaerales bacterium]|jgi:[acyl-carrier-protein] S-malonyltransferase